MTDIYFNRAVLVKGTTKLTRERIKVKELTIVESGQDGEYIWIDMTLEDGSKYQTGNFKNVA